MERSALREWLAAHGVRLPNPYPYTVRTLKGSALATLMTAVALLLIYTVWEITTYSARNMQRTLFMTIESTVASSEFAAEKAEQAWDRLFPTPPPITEESLRSILPPGSHMGLQMRAPLQQNTLPFQEGSFALTDAVRQVDFALIQTVIRLGLDRRVLLLSSDYHSQGRDTYHVQRMRLYLPPIVQSQPAPATGPAAPPSGDDSVKGPPEPVFRFLNALAESLDTWADRAVLTESPGKLTLAAKGVLTHEIWFETTKDPQPLQVETPCLTLVINGMGRDKAIAASLLALKLPITLSVLPFAPHAAATATAAHEAGQEVLVNMPLEAMQAPFVKAGPGELTTGMSAEDMRILVEDALRHVPYATGVSNLMGSRFTTDRAAVRRFCDILTRSGLYVLDDMTHQESLLYPEARRRGLPAWRRTINLNEGPGTAASVRDNLKKAEAIARARGHAVVIANPDPQVLEVLARWARERDTDIHLVSLRHQPRDEETLTPDDLPSDEPDAPAEAQVPAGQDIPPAKHPS